MGMSTKSPVKNNDPIFGGVSGVAASDTTDAFPGNLCRGLMVGTAGDVALIMADGTTVVWPNVAAGIVHPFVFSRIKATGTTALTFTVGKA